MSYAHFPPAIFDGVHLLYLTEGPYGPDGDLAATYTVRNAETGAKVEIVEIRQAELGGNEAPMRQLLEAP